MTDKLSNQKKTVKKTKLVALCGIIAAASVVVMLGSYIPFFTYAMPAVAGAFLIVIVLEANKKYAVADYAAVSILSLLLCEKESALCYALLFGFYPIVKGLIEKIDRRVVEWIIKIVLFNVMFTAILLLATYVFGIDAEEMGDLGKYSAIIMYLLGNFMFVLYDIALTTVVSLYMRKYRESFRRLLR